MIITFNNKLIPSIQESFNKMTICKDDYMGNTAFIFSFYNVIEQKLKEILNDNQEYKYFNDFNELRSFKKVLIKESGRFKAFILQLLKNENYNLKNESYDSEWESIKKDINKVISNQIKNVGLF